MNSIRKKYRIIIFFIITATCLMSSFICIYSINSKDIMPLIRIFIFLAMGSVFMSTFISLLLLEKWYYRKSNKKIMDEMNYDPLLRTLNRRAAIQDLTNHYNDFKYNDTTYAIFMLDVDDFKQINDTYGHDTGDRVLKKITDSIHSFIRNTDKLYRWGGEEFIIVCEGLKIGNIGVFSNKLINNINEITYEKNEDSISATISMGVSYFNENDKSFEDVIKRADIALYKAKSEGKNKIVLSKEIKS